MKWRRHQTFDESVIEHTSPAASHAKSFKGTERTGDHEPVLLVLVSSCVRQLHVRQNVSLYFEPRVCLSISLPHLPSSSLVPILSSHVLRRPWPSATSCSQTMRAMQVMMREREENVFRVYCSLAHAFGLNSLRPTCSDWAFAGRVGRRGSEGKRGRRLILDSQTDRSPLALTVHPAIPASASSEESEEDGRLIWRASAESESLCVRCCQRDCKTKSRSVEGRRVRE